MIASNSKKGSASNQCALIAVELPAVSRRERAAFTLVEVPAASIRKRAAFTLVELLVVIGIIALLISILLPALNRAREAAKSIKCQANLRTIGQALMMHANEHKQYMPLAGAQFANAKGWPVDGNGVKSNDIPANLADPGMTKYDYFYEAVAPGGPRPQPMSGALATYLGGSVRTDSWTNLQPDCATGVVQDTFICPSDNTAANSPASDLLGWGRLINDARDNSSSLGGYSSYFTNSEALGFALVTNGNPAGISNHSRAAGFIPSMGSSPTTLMLLSDGTSTSGWITFEFWSHNTPSTLKDVFNGNGAGSGGGGPGFDTVRHRGKMNVLFLDGHVENLTILDNGGTVLAGSGASGDLGNVYMVSPDFRK